MKKVLMKICEELGSVKYFLIEYYISIAAILFMLFTATVWPTAYRHDILKLEDIQIIVKTNRFTGTTWVFRPGYGWDNK